MKKLLISLIVICCFRPGFSQGIYNNGSKIIIGSGVYLNISGTGGNLRNETSGTNGSVDLNGTIKIEGNLVNNVAASDVFANLGPSGTVAFMGIAQQSISGSTSSPVTFNNLTVSNSSGLNLSAGVNINGTLTLNSGLVNIGNSNLTFGATSVVAGTPSATNMIVATGTGQVLRAFTGPGVFTFPVGDNNVTAKYSPVTLDVTSGTFSPGATIGINLVNAGYPDPLITGSYLNRYWNLSSNGITSLNCNAVFQYLPGDVMGTEADIYSLRIVPAPASFYAPANTGLHQLAVNGITASGTFTGSLGLRTINLTLFLEGLYNGPGVMRQAQGNAGNQYAGTTSDVISVELHDPVTYATKLYTASNVNLTTSGQASFTLPATYNGSYYLTVKHRNSIATVSSAPLSLASITTNFNFSTLASQAFGSNQKNVNGVYVIYGGDVNQDGFVGVGDMAGVDNQSALFGSGYINEDVNGDGFVGVTDMSIVDNNSSNFISTITP